MTKTIEKPKDVNHPPLAEGEVAIQRLPIWLPGFTCLIKYEPKYVFPLYKALWKQRDPKAPTKDSNDLVPRILDAFPPDISWKEAWLIAEEEDALAMERARLSAQFGRHPNGELLFDVVYPGDSFDVAFASALKPTLSTVLGNANPALDELESLDGVGEGLAQKLYEKGFRSIRDVALATEDELVKVLGTKRASRAKASAEAVFEAPAQAEQ